MGEGKALNANSRVIIDPQKFAVTTEQHIGGCGGGVVCAMGQIWG